jgi:hypothetical protein
VTTIAGGAFGDAAPLVIWYVLASGALSIAIVVASYNFGLYRYAFVVPVFSVACVEITTLSMWHPSLAAVVAVLLAGHVCVLAASLYGTAAAGPAAGPLESTDPVPATEPTIG